MTPDQLKALIHYRMEQAHETLREANILLDQSAFRGVVNRAYYAMFYAVLAVLATQQLGTSKHSGVLSLFDREFVKPGIFPRELSRSLHTAFELRQTYDYGELVTLDIFTVQEILISAQTSITTIETYLRNQGYLTP
jgi:uncharacterized protein (UPF0332 family)